ncbi:MAG: caspase family protein [Saprospiraceae bacterium]
MEILTKRIFGNYTLQEYLGSGSFSSVYIATHNYTKEQVALKVAHSTDIKLIEEFNHIVKTGLKGLLKIQHPNIIGIKEYFISSENNTSHFVMVLELIKGNSLDKIPNINSLSVQNKLNLFIKICNAIQFAHEFEYLDSNEYHSYKIKGIYHGDIKPNNIMVTPDLDPKIIDISFLNLKKISGENEPHIGNKEVNTGAFGTTGFMAPEQETLGVINEKTDIFALGIVLKQLIYGFKYENPGIKNTLHTNINKIIAKATHLNPNSRYDSVLCLRKDIVHLNSSFLIRHKWKALSIACTFLILVYFLFNTNNGSSFTVFSKNIQELNNDNQRGVKSKNENLSNIDLSKNKYYALLIGNNEYRHWKDLNYPIQDVNQMKNTLQSKYTFEKENIKIVENGTYEIIYKAFESFSDSGPNTYLLIYYAGHGKYDTETDKAALIPVDSELNSDSKNLTSDLIRDLLKKSKIHNILFISDACYLGAMASRGEHHDSIAKHDVSSFKSFASKQSRKFISSGAKETVPDKSYFNEYLIKYLNNNEHEFTFEYTIYNDIIEPIRRNSLTTPVYGVFFDTKDEGGHFFLIKRKNK